MSQMKEQEMAKEKESGSKPPLTPEESERLNQSVQKSEAQARGAAPASAQGADRHSVRSRRA